MPDLDEGQRLDPSREDDDLLAGGAAQLQQRHEEDHLPAGVQIDTIRIEGGERLLEGILGLERDLTTGDLQAPIVSPKLYRRWRERRAGPT